MQEKQINTERTAEKKSEQSRRCLRLLILAAGIVMMGIGIARGEAGTVFLKATNICLECIGIG